MTRLLNFIKAQEMGREGVFCVLWNEEERMFI